MDTADCTLESVSIPASKSHSIHPHQFYKLDLWRPRLNNGDHRKIDQLYKSWTCVHNTNVLLSKAQSATSNSSFSAASELKIRVKNLND